MKIAFLIFSLLFNYANACTDFIIQSKEGVFVTGRSLEFASEIESVLAIYPQGEERSSKAPNGKSSIQWKRKYGFVGANAFQLPFVVDGLNEAGLSCGFLWLPGTEYQTIAPSDSNKALDFMDFGDWILSNFATTQEVKEAVKQVRIWGHHVPALPEIPPVHAVIHDATGQNLVIEFIKGEMKVYDNPIGVTTNSPPFDWQITNLQNYIHLTAENAAPIQWNGVSVHPTGQGSGMMGIPGDWTPPSRFVKIATYLRFITQPQTALEAVNLAQHLLNSVDIPKGTIHEQGATSGDYTQWSLIKDLSNKIFYFRSYQDLTLKSVNLKQLNLKNSSPKRVAIGIQNEPIDLTNLLNIK